MKEDFFKYQAQTTTHPLAMEISHAEGSYIYDKQGKAYLDFVAGVSANSVGHRHPEVVKAVKDQLDTYMHVMVYGEYIQEKAVALSKRLSEILPDPIETTYLTNSGTEAMEGAIKMARRFTGRSEIIAANKAYHGNTMGALSIMGYEERKRPFRPLIPDVRFVEFNALEDLQHISKNTAAVVLETIQGGAGFILPDPGYLETVSKACKANGALLILDEIQPGIGRTGTMFGFEHFNCKPDIVVMGKGLGGGMPIGAFSASRAIMQTLSENPKLGHITTFGGHPVIASAALATLDVIEKYNLMDEIASKEILLRTTLKHNLIKEIRGKGLMLAAIFPTPDLVNKLILRCQDRGLILFWLLFEPCAVRITPPLTITNQELIDGCQIIIEVLDELQN
ncbi:MAG: aspartate aminotransferase family protein [Flavobacteriaceae bacterium]|nr:aspartate aminotransferase family protein [Bacteroidia bacterium]NNL80492.1 aspartate aminotransferase family protein [Flavobacteriaceae bacterium]